MSASMLDAIFGRASRGRIYALAGVATSQSDTYATIGAIQFNSADVDSSETTVTFKAILDTTNATLSAFVDLYDVAGSAVVTGSELESDSETAECVSASISIPSAMAASDKVYLLRLKLESTSATETATCYGAWLEFTETIEAGVS